MSFDSLPCEIRAYLLEFVLGREEIKCCRLVCWEWYSYFDRPCVRDKENLVLDTDRRSPDELNNILLNYHGLGVHVNLMAVELKLVKFCDFGDKIRGLKITNSLDDSVKTIVDMFTLLPNMIYFHFHRKNFDFDFTEYCKFAAVIADLHQSNFKHANLRSFEIEDLFTPNRQLYETFPCLDGLHFEVLWRSSMEKNNVEIKKDLKELSRIKVLLRMKPSMIERNFLMSPPRLKKLEIDVWHVREHKDSFNMCLNFFTQQTELESLIISFRCHKEKYILRQEVEHYSLFSFGCRNKGHLTWHYENGDFEHISDNNCRAKTLLSHILENCRNLKILHFDLHCEDLQFDDADMQEFTRLLRSSKIKDLKFPFIALQCSAFSSQLALLQNLESLELHRVYYAEDDNDEGLKPKLYFTKFYDALLTILQSNKRLKKLKLPSVFLYDEKAMTSSSNMKDLNVKTIYHDRLEHLELYFQDPKAPPSLIEYLVSWELPRLQTLKIAPASRLWHESYVANSKTKKRLMKWIKKMPCLKRVKIGSILLDMDDILKICKRLPRVRSLSFENKKLPPKSKLQKLFKNFPTVEQLTCKICEKRKPTDYFTIRSVRYLLIRERKLVYTQEFSAGYAHRTEPFFSL